MPKAMEEYEKLFKKDDPEDNPYKSKYLARDLLETGPLKELEKFWKKEKCGGEGDP